MNTKCYPRDAQRTKEQEFLSLKQESLSVIEYAAKFNELSRFAPHQVATEEMKIDHFEEGLQGNIRSMIAGQTFENIQEMYQCAVKIARVLEETERENRATNPRKRKIEFGNRGPRGGNPNRFNVGRLQDKGKRPMAWQSRPPCRICSRSHVGPCTLEPLQCYGCREMGHEVNNCPKTT